MPELPEVETTRRGVEPHLTGSRIQALEVREPRLRWPVPAELAKNVENGVIRSVTRRGKYILLETVRDEAVRGYMLLHLGMSGSLRVVPADTAVEKHDHVDLKVSLQGRTEVLRLRDPRRFGAWLWIDGPEPRHALLDSLGPEPLSNAFTGDYLHGLAKGRRLAVKNFIMDSHVVVGVGNIYANEALFMAGIHPSRGIGRISKSRFVALVEAIKTVLSKAIDQGGTTLRDFTSAKGKPGYFKQELQVYGRGGQPCMRCGESLTLARHGQRATVYCPKCQT